VRITTNLSCPRELTICVKELTGRDDLESLAYTLLFLLRGHLPWILYLRLEPLFRQMMGVRNTKVTYSGAEFIKEGVPPPFGYLLDYSRGLGFDQTPAYSDLRCHFSSVMSLHNFSVSGLLDWSPAPTIGCAPDPATIDENDWLAEDDDGIEDVDSDTGYVDWDIDCWDYPQKERDEDLELDPELEESLDHQILSIVLAEDAFRFRSVH